MSKPPQLSDQLAYAAESLGSLAKPARIDREGGYVYGVRLVNPNSVNGRHYPPDVLNRDNGQYEGAAVGLGHSAPLDQDLPPEKKFARVVNVRPAADGTGGREGDLRFNPKHPFADQFCWACEHDPAMYSLSQVALIKWRAEKSADGRLIAEAILKVARVDIVATGGTTSSVFESANLPKLVSETPVAFTVADAVGLISDPSALDKFMSDLFDGLPSGVFSPDVKRNAATRLLVKIGTPTPASESAAVDWLRTLGHGGTWVAENYGSMLSAKSKAEATAKARALCKDRGLADALASDTFVLIVAESLNDPNRAAALIDDRKALTPPTSPTPTPTPGTPPRTTPAGGGTPTPTKSIRQTAHELAAG